MRYLFNKGWKFLELNNDSDLETAMAHRECFKPVQIPHDWLIYDSTDLYRDGTGWYIRELDIDEKKGRYFLEFDAVYMDSHVYVNGICVCEWKYGYSAFSCEITDVLREGKNLITVSACYRSPNSRWYSGAGIFRNVYIRQTEGTYIARDGVYVSNRMENGNRILKIETEILGTDPAGAFPEYTVTDADGNTVDLEKYGEGEYIIRDPHLWDVNDPYLYTLKTVLRSVRPENGSFDTSQTDKAADHSRTDTSAVLDELTLRFGIRDIEFDPEKGFLLNGNNIKLNGVCEHHDLGALGAAFNKCAMKRKLTLLKEMGANAIRTSHNMPAPEVLDLCDEMGFLVMTESFDMWYRSKTEYDYARFFADWHERDMESWVKQDRNHPCVIMWSIGNEIYDMHADENAPDIVRHLMDVVCRYDPYKNAVCTFASNYMPWEGAQKCADVIKLVGYNYCEKNYEEHHKAHPDWVIYGSETGSLVQSRGVYKFPLSATMLTDVDEQCSALGNCNTSWGAKSFEDLVCVDRDTDYSAGQFIWTGFDYIGEPTPYHTKNSYFGLLDTAGFPKDLYYVVKSQWTKPEGKEGDCVNVPFVHVFPHPDLNPGQHYDLRFATNCNNVYLSDEEPERYTWTSVCHDKGSDREKLIATWNGKFYSNDYEMRINCEYGENNRKSCGLVLHPYSDSDSVTVCADRETMRAGSDDIIFVEIGTVDRDGNPVCNACDRVTVEVTGAGRLMGLDNGDSTDPDSYKGTSRRLFNGKLLAMIAPKTEAGEVRLKVSARGLKSCEKVFKCTDETFDRTLNGYVAYPSPFDKGTEEYLEENKPCRILLGSYDDIPVRKIEIKRIHAGSSDDPYFPNAYTFTPECTEKKVSVRILPENATDRELIWEVVNDKGVPTGIAEVIPGDCEATLRAKGDGDFRLRCMSKSGTDKIRVISEMDYRIKGLGKATLDPYDFIYGSIYSYSEGEIGAGNDMGFATARGERSLVAFENVDFGRSGSDEITIPVFALDDSEYSIRVYDGIPSQGGKLIGDLSYSKPMIWNVYQEDSWKLDTFLKGIHTIAFEFNDKVHVKGFSFKKYNRAYMELHASDADEIYGDSYTVSGNDITGIGNNVSLTFKEMEFGDEGARRITICGRAPKGTNTIHLRFFTPDGETAGSGDDGMQERREVLEFVQSDEYVSRSFEFDNIKGMKDVSFIFMPGSDFDMRSFMFGR